MNFKRQHSNGFSLIEVMLALSMIGIILTSLLMLESRIFKRVVACTQKMERFAAIKNLFLLVKKEGLPQDSSTYTALLQDPDITVQYEKKAIEKTSALARFKGVMQEVATGTWDEWGQQREYAFYTYCFVGIPKKKDDTHASS